MKKFFVFFITICLVFCFTSSLSVVKAGGITDFTEKDSVIIDKLDIIDNHEPRSEVRNVSVLRDNVSKVGDTSRAVFGGNSSDSYIEYKVNGQNTVVVYAYEKILKGNIRPENLIYPKFSVTGTNHIEEDATETTVEVGRFTEPEKYSRIKMVYKFDSKENCKIRIHFYNNIGKNNYLQIGRVEIYNSTATTEREIKGSSSKFQITGWITTPEIGYDNISDSVDFERSLSDIAESGINFNLPNTWKGDTIYYRQRLIECCEKLEIKTLIHDEELVKFLISDEYDEEIALNMAKTYKDSLAFAGHVIVDEPDTMTLSMLEEAASRYKKLFPGKLFYINLLPINAVANYDEYLETYFNSIKEGRVSYDYYVLTGSNESEYDMKPYHLLNLNNCAEKAKKYHADLYTIIASTGHMNESDHKYLRNIKSEADLSFQAYSSMAYGAKGITWFTCFAMGDGRYGEQPGMYDKNGNKTKTYDYVKSIDEKIRFFSDQYLKYNWSGTIFTEGSQGDTNINFLNCHNKFTTHPQISSIKADHDVITGVFEGDKGNALMLVNYNDPCLKLTPTVEMTFDKPYNLKIYSDGTFNEVKMNDCNYTFNLVNGGGIFIELEDIKSENDSSDDGSENENKSGCAAVATGNIKSALFILSTVGVLIIGLRRKIH